MRFSNGEKRTMGEEWKQSLIVKVLRKMVGFRFIERQLNQSWALRAHISISDLGNDFSLVRFDSEDGYIHALHGGPWLIGDHYLIVREWKPNFDPSDENINLATVWVRLPKLPIEYYDGIFFNKVGSVLGRLFRVDAATESAIRGKFARIGVEVDLSKPLISKFRMRHRYWMVEYEGLHLVCFKCGTYGHKIEDELWMGI